MGIVPLIEVPEGSFVHWVIFEPREVEFKSGETDAEDGQGEDSEGVFFQGPYFVDLLTAIPQILDTQAVTSKTIKRIKMKLEAAENSSSANWPSDAPAGLVNHSIFFAGTFGGSNTPFSFASSDVTEFSVSGSSGIAPQDGQNLLLSIQLANIVRMIDLSALSSAADKNISDSNRISASQPCPTIDNSSSDLYTCFRKGLENESKLGNDADGNGELESNEDSADN